MGYLQPLATDAVKLGRRKLKPAKAAAKAPQVAQPSAEEPEPRAFAVWMKSVRAGRNTEKFTKTGAKETQMPGMNSESMFEDVQ